MTKIVARLVTHLKNQEHGWHPAECSFIDVTEVLSQWDHHLLTSVVDVMTHMLIDEDAVGCSVFCCVFPPYGTGSTPTTHY